VVSPPAQVLTPSLAPLSSAMQPHPTGRSGGGLASPLTQAAITLIAQLARAEHEPANEAHGYGLSATTIMVRSGWRGEPRRRRTYRLTRLAHWCKSRVTRLVSTPGDP
jgi:hypothetical protein